jgi:hypothetical protein
MSKGWWRGGPLARPTIEVPDSPCRIRVSSTLEITIQDCWSIAMRGITHRSAGCHCRSVGAQALRHGREQAEAGSGMHNG